MIIKPNDKLFLVVIPLPGHPYVGHPTDNPEWEIDMIADVTLEQLHDVFRGTPHSVDGFEVEYLATTYDEALDIVFRHFPELEPQGPRG